MVPRLVRHADWSVHPRKRWIASATLHTGVYRVTRPEPVRHARRLLDDSLALADGGGALLGFDFAIGLPRAYARRAHIDSFLHALPAFGTGHWSRFYDLAECPEDLSLHRPFYPKRPGGALREHLVKGLGLRDWRDLLRECEVAVEGRGGACPLFWTLGGNQVGRAALAGWREVVVPALQRTDTHVGIWPFEGELPFLVRSRACVIAETYPADACVQLGMPAPGRAWSKRNQADRVSRAAELRAWASGKPIDLTDVAPLITEGFGDTPTGEDQFDAVVGLLGLLGVVLGYATDGRPADPVTNAVEGWILGRSHD